MRTTSNQRRVRGQASRTAALLLAVLVGGACAGRSDAKAAPPTTAAPTTVAPTTTTDPKLTPVDQVPDVITVEYVQRVMDALDHVEGELTRKLVRDRVPSLEFRQMLTALYDEPAFSKAEASFGRDAAQRLDIYVDNPGDPTSRVNRILDSTPSCVVADVDRSLGPELKRQPSPDETKGVVFLRLKKNERDPLRVNRTAWSISADGRPAPGADLSSACG